MLHILSSVTFELVNWYGLMRSIGPSKNPLMSLLTLFLYIVMISLRVVPAFRAVSRHPHRFKTCLSFCSESMCHHVADGTKAVKPNFSILTPITCRKDRIKQFSRGFNSKSESYNEEERDQQSDSDETDIVVGLSSSLSDDDFALDPQSELARNITRSLGILDHQHDKLTSLAILVVEWNERLNLVSRKDCSVPVVFGRHILPSIALSGILFSETHDKITGMVKKKRIIDVGTGGGFPGMPLAILFPDDAEFLLVDSIGKKLKAIDEMAQELNVTNVRTYHGRVEEMVQQYGTLHKNAYDFCIGRSVAPLPTFCFWTQDLLKMNDGKLLYIIGGDIEPFVQAKVTRDIPINQVFGRDDVSDKRILIFQSKQVVEIADRSGEKKRIVGTPKLKSRSKSPAKGQSSGARSNLPQGAWKKRDNSIKKDRGYDDFKRYES